MQENHFDKAAATWDENPVRRAMVEAIAGGIRRHIKHNPPKRMLDFGCGTGNLSLNLADAAGEILAVDTSRGMIEEFNRKLADLPELKNRITACQIEFPNEAMTADGFDLVCMSMVLHHVADHAELLKRLVNILAPGGKIAVADLYEEDGQFHQDMAVPHNGFDPQKLVEILAEAGCGEITFREVHKIAKPVADGKMREFPIFLLIAAL